MFDNVIIMMCFLGIVKNSSELMAEEYFVEEIDDGLQSYSIIGEITHCNLE